MLIGSLMLFALLAFLASVFAGAPEWPAAAAIWLAALLGWRLVDAMTLRLSLILLALGGAAVGFAAQRGGETDLLAMLVINLPIIGLFLGVAFLSLVGASQPSSGAGDAAERRATGPQGNLWTTLGAVHLIGAVINLSMTAMSGDRMARDGGLGRREAIVLARAHCAAAFWSPFFVAAAVVHTYAPGAAASVTVPLGIIGALAALLLTARDVRRPVDATEAATPFIGIVPETRALVLTGALLIAALGLNALLGDVPMVIVVTAVTPPLALLFMPAAARAGAFERLLRTTLPASIGQVVLFLAAGVFATGIASLLSGAPGLFAAFEGEVALWMYPLATASIIVAGYLGAHPVISIAALSAVLLPLGADQSLLAFAFLSGWAIGTAVAPLSGMNLFLMGRYRVRARDLIGWGPSYALQMLAVVALLCWLGARFLR